MNSRKPREYENFDRTMRKLITVSHSDIKAKLDAEKAEKRPRGKRSIKKQAKISQGS